MTWFLISASGKILATTGRRGDCIGIGARRPDRAELTVLVDWHREKAISGGIKAEHATADVRGKAWIR